MVQPDPRIGTILNDRYRLLQLVGQGSMASVYRAERLQLKREVAIKFLRESFAVDADGRRRFEIEAKAMSRLVHPNCISVIDFGLDGDSPYLVMDFVTGRTLRQALATHGGPLVPRHAINLTKQILAGLAHAHQHGIIHRDMKPENVLVTEVAGVGEQARIADFGLAKLRDEVTVTTGVALGTPSYMSPEQTIGQSASITADIYAMGIILFEMLTGQKPYRADSPFEIMRLHREAPIPTLSSMVPDHRFSKQLETVVQTALGKEPAWRYPSAETMLQALDKVPEGQPGGYKQKAWWQFWK
jgi:serine/threonine-protein kinase